jgi:hypothetical protein
LLYISWAYTVWVVQLVRVERIAGSQYKKEIAYFLVSQTKYGFVLLQTESDVSAA